MQLNEMKNALTYRWLKVNDATVEWPIGQKTVFNGQASRIERGIEIEQRFGRTGYGLSDELLKLHKEQENLVTEYIIRDQAELTYLERKQKAADHTLVDRLDLQLESGAEAVFVVDYSDESGLTDLEERTEALRHSLLRVWAGKESSLRLIIVQRQQNTAHVFSQLALRLEEGAKVTTTYVNIGAAATYLNYDVELLGKEAEHKVDTVYFLESDQVFDTLYQVRHFGIRSVSDLQSKGVLKDQAKKLFRGIIDFKRGCRGSSGNEEEFVTVLNKGTISRSVPILLCTEDDVNGNHASSVGQIEEDPLFYIMSRGIDEQEAKRLLVEAKLFPLLDGIVIEALRDAVKENLHQRLR